MKIFSVDQIFSIEKDTQEVLNVPLNFLMEKACEGIVNFILQAIENKKIPQGKILVVAGKGNNGGDGFLCASNLLSLGFSVDVLVLHSSEETSFLNTKYRNVFCFLGGKLWKCTDIENIPFFSYTIIIDAILGIGFKIGKNFDFYRDIIQKINTASSCVISIDVPSGLDVDKGLFDENFVVKANITLGLGFPKLGYFLDESKDVIGELHLLSLPIPQDIINKFDTKYFLLVEEKVEKYFPKHSLAAHKYDKGMVIGIGGKRGMKGALSLACLAALYSGSGLVTGISPSGSGFAYDSQPYEIIKLESSFKEEEDIFLKRYLKKAKSIFLGPGLGSCPNFSEFVERVINLSNLPVVFDADALNLYAQAPFSLPDRCVFTPHIGEMKRILKIKEKISLGELLKQTLRFSKEKNVVIVLKGAFTFIFSKDKIFISTQGNVSLATAGSGDILTGIISSFLAQGLEPEKAACLGVFVQGLSAKKASKCLASCFFKSGDFIPYIGRVLQEMKEKEKW